VLDVLWDYLAISGKENKIPFTFRMYERSERFIYVDRGTTGAAFFHIAASWRSNPTDLVNKTFLENPDLFSLNSELKPYGIKLVWEEKEMPAFMDEEGKPCNATVTYTTLFWEQY
jgi:hypothetical protein